MHFLGVSKLQYNSTEDLRLFWSQKDDVEVRKKEELYVMWQEWFIIGGRTDTFVAWRPRNNAEVGKDVNEMEGSTDTSARNFMQIILLQLRV